jgi:hypothetical protein
MKVALTFALLMLVSVFVCAQQSNTVTLDLKKLRSQLKAAPMEDSPAAKSSQFKLELPLPDGSAGLFKVAESPLLDKAFAAQRPDLKTYAVQSVDDPAVTGRFTLSDFGLNGVLLTQAGLVNIYPVDIMKPTVHKSVLGAEFMEAHECPVTNSAAAPDDKGSPSGGAKSGAGNGATRRTYRIAVVGTGEFYKGNGNSAAAAQTAVVNSMNAIQAIYDKDMAVRFTVLTPFIYPDFATDPFNPGLDRTLEAAQAVNANFAQATYDIGHVFHDTNESNDNLGGGGIASLGVVCSNDPTGTGFSKGGGWSGSGNNVGDGWINLLAHELGHQFNAEHTFNGTGSNCTNAISNTTAYEIASGSTIMSYQGICIASQNIPGDGAANHYFHARSLEQMLTYLNGTNCAQTTATGNTPPVVNANPCGGNYTIPKSTPFTLTGSGVDPNGDVIFYTWEQYNEDGPGTPTQGLIGAAAGANPNAPLFRSYPPNPSPSRTFPAMQNVISGNPSDFEPLPSVGRTLNFRLTGRDNNPNGGGMHCSDIAVTVHATAGPFAVTSPNGGENWAAGGNVTVTWNNGGSNAFCNNVNIRLSIDGGNSYPILLAGNVSNATGTWTGNLPAGATNTTTARVKVECADNTCVVFFDISNANFSITSGCQAAANFICPDAAVTFAQGAAGLNLGLNNGFGSNTTVFNYNVTNASPMYSVVAANQGGNGCNDFQFQNHYGVVQFSVDKTGAYTFTKNVNEPGFTIMNLFQNAFAPAAPCPNWVASSATTTANGGVGGGDNLTATLTACNTYFIVLSKAFQVGGLTGTVTATGPGTLKMVANPPPAGFGYTYAAVNTTNNNIAAVSATSNFTTLAPGSYQVYGASHAGGVDPNTFVGQTIGGVYASGACVLFSTNFKPVTVTGGGGGACTITAAGLSDVQCNNNNTPNNPADDFFTFKLNPTGTNLGNGYSVTGAAVTPTAAPYGLATTFSRPAGTLGAGNAMITIQDNGNATCQLAATVNSPALVVTMGATTNPANCNATNGSALIGGLTNGQQYNVNYKFNGTAANAGPLTADANGQINLMNLGAGNFTEIFVSPTGGGCSGGPLTFTLNNPGQPAYTVAGTNPTTCGGTDGNFTLSGLTANTVYQVGYTAGGNAVAPADFTANANGQVVVPNLGANAYTNITASLMGCPGTPVSVTLANAAPPAYTINSTNPTTNGGMDGTITIGGAMPDVTYSYTYKIGGITVNGTTFSSNTGNIMFTDLAAGAYTEIIVTINGCASNPMMATLTDPPQNFFLDEDNDGFPGGNVITASGPPPGYKAANELVSMEIDCNDLNANEFPGQIWWQDLDGDGCGDGTFYVECAQPAFCKLAHDMLVTTGDCNDNDPNNAPLNVPEVCNGRDDDCDGEVDEGGVATFFFRDADGDGFGDPYQWVLACPPPAGYVDNDFDCNDNNSSIKPFRDEICNLIDENCNGIIDEGEHTYVGDLFFSTQAELDAFLPCWTKIDGDLTISGNSIFNLGALSNVKEVTRNVNIQYTSISNMIGLDNLTTVGGKFKIKTNTYGPRMSSLDGLEALSYVGKSLVIYYNFNLTDCCAISDLINTPGAVASKGGVLSIFANKTGCDNIPEVNVVCGSSSSAIQPLVNVQTTSKAMDEEPLEVSPNPTQDQVFVSINKDFETATLSVYDISNKLLQSNDLRQGDALLRLDLSTYRAGIYLITLTTNGQIFHKKIVVAR